MTLSDLKGHSPIVSRFQSGLLCSCTLVYTISTNSVSRGPSTVDDSLFPIKCLYSYEERAFGFIECALKISNGQSLKFHNECYYSVTSVLIYIHTFKAVVIPDGCIVDYSIPIRAKKVSIRFSLPNRFFSIRFGNLINLPLVH